MEHAARALPPELELPMKWGWMLALGIAMLLIGSVGIGFAAYLTLASVMTFGILAIFAGVLQTWHGLSAGGQGWSGRILHLFVAIAYLVLGGLLVLDPVSASVSLTLVLTAFLFALGVSRLVYAWRCRSRKWRWRLALAGGLVDLILGAIILADWPGNSLLVIGLILAIEFILNGWMLIAGAFAARALQKEGG